MNQPEQLSAEEEASVKAIEMAKLVATQAAQASSGVH